MYMYMYIYIYICIQDPVHFAVFQDLLAKEGINAGIPIDHEFFRTRIAGNPLKHHKQPLKISQVTPQNRAGKPLKQP